MKQVKESNTTLGKGQNIFGATTLTIGALAPTYLVIQESDSNVQPAGQGVNGGTPLTTGYWLPLTIANNTGQPWGGVYFRLGFGSPSTVPFRQVATFDNLDFNFPALAGGGLGVRPTYTPMSSAFQGQGVGTTALQSTYPGPAGETILWNNGRIQPGGGGNTFQWKLDVPNAASIQNTDQGLVPQQLYTTDADGKVIGYSFTIEIVPVIAPEPGAAALGLVAAVAGLFGRRSPAVTTKRSRA